ncbi:hypothetical protein TanjilG_15816 [Lupinus angustifolius]|uniref:Uncharacterized protein n=1 Tax=Lupinus angustifolius TaxID=3871 RepID=A0A1J7FNN7_LUPAN|nr:hypothetical protein TanjilG_15816 [Lupinus angustifolius]
MDNEPYSLSTTPSPHHDPLTVAAMLKKEPCSKINSTWVYIKASARSHSLCDESIALEVGGVTITLVSELDNGIKHALEMNQTVPLMIEVREMAKNVDQGTARTRDIKALRT